MLVNCKQASVHVPTVQGACACQQSQQSNMSSTPVRVLVGVLYMDGVIPLMFSPPSPTPCVVNTQTISPLFQAKIHQ